MIVVSYWRDNWPVDDEIVKIIRAIRRNGGRLISLTEDPIRPHYNIGSGQDHLLLASTCGATVMEFEVPR